MSKDAPPLYKGLICAMHPELEGLRTYTHKCARCLYGENGNAWPEKLLKSNGPQPDNTAIDPSIRYYGKLCAKHPELEGLRRTKGHKCVQCFRDRNNKAERRKNAAVLPPSFTQQG
jgi:hypothetical protein